MLSVTPRFSDPTVLWSCLRSCLSSSSLFVVPEAGRQLRWGGCLSSWWRACLPVDRSSWPRSASLQGLRHTPHGDILVCLPRHSHSCAVGALCAPRLAACAVLDSLRPGFWQVTSALTRYLHVPQKMLTWDSNLASVEPQGANYRSQDSVSMLPLSPFGNVVSL